MMDYGMFKEVVKELIMDYMPERFQNRQVRVWPVYKVNRELDALSLIDPDMQGQEIAPLTYVNNMYENYQKSEDLEETLRKTASSLEKAYEQRPQKIDLTDGRDRVVMQLVNTEWNGELLKNAPHREVCDLSLIYRLVLGRREDQLMTAQIDDLLAERLGMSEPELYERAMENTRRMSPPVTLSIEEAMGGILFEDQVSESRDLLEGEKPLGLGIYVLTNRERINGAVSMLYEDRLHEMAERLGTDFYLLPASIHEMLAVPVCMGSADALARTVAEVNRAEVEPENRLSDQVYHYDKELRVLGLAADKTEKTPEIAQENPGLEFSASHAAR